MSVKDLEGISAYSDDPTIQTMMESQKTMRELIKLRVRQLETEKRLTTLEGKVENGSIITSEQEHLLNQKRDKFVSLKSQNGMDSKRAFGWFYKAVKGRFHLGVRRGMEQEKFPYACEWIDDLIAKEEAKRSHPVRNSMVSNIYTTRINAVA
jgi:hypothetical protein